MRTLTLIANSLDARMLRDILALEGLHVRLATAPASKREGGAIALQIANDDFDRARIVLAQWMADHPGSVQQSASDP